VIDLHNHLLPGVDDGPATVPAAVEMARAFVRDRTATAVCTPHLLEDPGAVVRSVETGVPALRAALRAAGVPLAILPGAEIGVEMALQMSDDELRGASLGGTGRWLLVELPFRGWPLGLPRLLADLEIRGFSVVLAHPERAEAVQRAPDRLRDLVGRGALAQVTAGSFLGEHGRAAGRCATLLVREGMATLMASDAHSAGWRPPSLTEGLAAAARALRTEPEELGFMVQEGPALVVEGRDVRPPRLSTRRKPPPAAHPARSGSAPRPRR
jgi:protein-tyrosine phosphatase